MQIVWEAGFALEQSGKDSSQEGGDHKAWASGLSVVTLFIAVVNHHTTWHQTTSVVAKMVTSDNHEKKDIDGNWFGEAHSYLL